MYKKSHFHLLVQTPNTKRAEPSVYIHLQLRRCLHYGSKDCKIEVWHLRDQGNFP